MASTLLTKPSPQASGAIFNSDSTHTETDTLTGKTLMPCS